MTPSSGRTKSRSPSPTALPPYANGGHQSERRLSAISTSSANSVGSEILWEELSAGANPSDRLRADLAAAGDDGFILDGFVDRRNSSYPDHDLTTQALSATAEEILANAKRRLTVCPPCSFSVLRMN